MSFEDQPPEKLRSLLRVKAEGAVWTLIFAAVFYLVFYSVRGHFVNVNPLRNVMVDTDWSITVVCICTVFTTFLFTKVYYAFNPDIQTNQNEILRKIWFDMQQLKKEIPVFKTELEEIKMLVEPLEPKEMQ